MLKLRTEIGSLSIGGWMLVLLAGLAIAIWISPVYALFVVALLYAAAFSYKIYEVRQEKKILRVAPPVAPLPDLQPVTYQGLFNPLKVEAPPVLTATPTPSVLRQPAIRIQPDKRLEAIRQLHLAIYELVVVNRQAPVVEVIGDDILKEAQELLEEAHAVGRAKNRLDADIAASHISPGEIARLEASCDEESDPRLQITLRETLATKKSELSAIQQMEKDRAYHGALLSQAEASLSELRSRLALTITKAREYANPEESQGLVEASGDLRSISEAMRKTLAELTQ